MIIKRISAASPSLEKQIKDTFRAKLRVSPNIQFVSASEILKAKNSQTQRKPVDFIDLRSKIS